MFEHRRGGQNHAVQLPDKHGRLGKAPEAGQLRPAAGRLLFAAEHTHLPGAVAEFHDMAAAVKARQRPAEIVHDYVKASAA